MKLNLSNEFLYWHQLRKGQLQAQIAEDYGISRQAVSKAVKKYEHKALVRLLDLAQAIGALVEFHDAMRGILIAQVPQLTNQLVIIIIDQYNNLKVFYNSSNLTKDTDMNFRQTMSESLGIQVQQNDPFNNFVKQIFR